MYVGVTMCPTFRSQKQTSWCSVILLPVYCPCVQVVLNVTLETKRPLREAGFFWHRKGIKTGFTIHTHFLSVLYRSKSHKAEDCVLYSWRGSASLHETEPLLSLITGTPVYLLLFNMTAVKREYILVWMFCGWIEVNYVKFEYSHLFCSHSTCSQQPHEQTTIHVLECSNYWIMTGRPAVLYPK